MAHQHLIADLSHLSSEPLKLAYVDHSPPSDVTEKGALLLIHGFPQTSHQFRHAVPCLAAQGFRCIVPDYRGAGASSKPADDFRKSTMAADMVALLDYLSLEEPVHVVGHDIGGMIAYALAARWPARVKSVIWGKSFKWSILYCLPKGGRCSRKAFSPATPSRAGIERSEALQATCRYR